MPEIQLLSLTDSGSSCFPHLQEIMKKELISGSRYGARQECAWFCQGLVYLSDTLQAWHWAERQGQRNVPGLQEGVSPTKKCRLGDLQWEINSYEKAWGVAEDSFIYRLFLYLRITQSSTPQTHCSCSTSLFSPFFWLVHPPVRTSIFPHLSAFTGKNTTACFLKAELGEVMLWSPDAGSSPQRVCPAANSCMLLFLVFCECLVSFALGVSLNCWGFSGDKAEVKSWIWTLYKGQNLLGAGLLNLFWMEDSHSFAKDWS